ncbi:MAG: DUF1616 domain-containing protein [Nitrososphaerota archaeon]|nr:DUF1616 domain-containing protein [Nitrososphaerota archaeon]
MDRETAILALAVVTILAVFAAIYPVIPSNSERFSELGVLGPTQQIGGYPSTEPAGQSFLLYVYVGNHEAAPSYYQVEVKAGNLSTAVSNSTAAAAPVILTRSLALADNSSSVFPVTVAMPTAGLNQRLIFELWMFNSTDAQFYYTGLWNQIFINVTSTSG